MLKKDLKRKSSILHLGCGMDKRPNSIGIDINTRSKADIIHDLNVFPYPFNTNQFKEIIADNVIEHLDDIPKVMEEIYRISRNGAKVLITTSHFSSMDSFTDPTHKHFFTSMTFDYFIPGTDLYKYSYSKVRFKKVKVTVGPVYTTNFLLKMLLALINENIVWYEKRFAFLFPVGVINYELEVVKL